MRVAIICLESTPAASFQKNIRLKQSILLEHTELLQQDQALAITRTLSDSEKLSPLLVCNRGSRLSARAVKGNIPVLELLTGQNPLDILRLWRWQRQEDNILALAVGEGSIKCAQILRKMRKAASLQFNAAFFTPICHDKPLVRQLNGVSHCICGSEHIAETLTRAAKAPKHLPKTQVILPGIELEKFTKMARDWQADRHFIFGMSESLVEKSGALVVVRAMASLWQKESLPHWEMRLFGKGDRFEEILAEARKLRVNSRLSILGSQPLPTVIPDCHVWLAPGYSTSELPSTLYGGIAAQAPVICADSPLHKERLGNSDAALQVEKKNPQALGKAMIQLMLHPELRHALMEKAALFRPQTGVRFMANQVRGLIEEWVKK